MDSLLLLPLVLPPTVVGFFLLVLFGRNGPLGRLLLQLGATVVFLAGDGYRRRGGGFSPDVSDGARGAGAD